MLQLMVPFMLGRGENQLAVLFITLLTYVITHYHQYIIALVPWRRRYVEYHMVARITYVNNMMVAHVPLKTKALVYEVLNVLSRTEKKAFTVEELMIDRINNEVLQCITFANNDYFQITPNIFIKTKLDQNITRNGVEEFKCFNYKISLYSQRYLSGDITAFVENCVKKFQQYKMDQLKDPHIFVFEDYCDEYKKLAFEEIPFNSTKSFDNMFFEQKDELIRKLNYFRDNKADYQRLGIPYTCGVLLHGQPGCGKTSCIKSIAQYTQRHIIVIPVKKIKTIQVLKKLFMTPKINDYIVPNDKRLYVFEEIDCGQWRNVVASRSVINEQPNELTVQEILSMGKAGVLEESVASKLSIQNKMEVTLGDFLELLDGIIEISGRMLVMTSNHPEILDSALMRPGRLDMIINFKKMTRKDVCNMYYLWFQEALPRHVMAAIKDYVFSQADISYIFSSKNRDNIHECLMRGEVLLLEKRDDRR